MNTELSTSHGTIEGKKDVLVKDLRGAISDADALIQEVASSAAGGFAAARTNVRGKMGELTSRIDDARNAALHKAKYAADTTHEYVRDNPGKAIGVAAVAGLVIGFLLRRR
jgi:ElaB/YqjD/DUF883 family membrane-anchored ribosome-binding protein